MTPDALREQWRARRANAPLRAEMTFEDGALVLGAGAILAKTAAASDGASDDARLAALLGVAHRRPVAPRALAHIRRAIVKKREGETTLALIHLALSSVAKLERPAEGARRLFIADELMKAGIAPGAVIDAFKRFGGTLDDLERRYDPDQPRVPAGNGRESGQWTSDDWADAPAASASATSSKHPARQTPSQRIQIADNSPSWFRYLNSLNPIGEAQAQTAEAEPEREENGSNSEESKPFVTYFDPETGRYYEYPRANRPPSGWVNMERLPKGPAFIGPTEAPGDPVADASTTEQSDSKTSEPESRGPIAAAAAAIATAAARAAQLARNRAVGSAFEEDQKACILASGKKVAPQITLKTDSGVKVRGDFLTLEPKTGEIGGVEAKGSATARLTPNQRRGFPEIAETGGTIVGAGKPDFPGGTRIPPTRFKIVRPGSEKFMTVDQTDVIDFCATKDGDPEISLIIADHLPWDEDEAYHLWLLQNKINKYLAAIESGEFYEKVPMSIGKNIVIELIPKYPLSKNAKNLVDKFKALIRSFGFDLRVVSSKSAANGKS